MENPEYTEFGIKIHKLRLTLKVQRRQSSESPQTPAEEQPTAVRRRGETARSGRRSRTNSTASLADSLRNLDLDPSAGSRRGFYQDFRSSSGTRLANWEFQGFYSSPPPLSPGARTSTSSSGYGSAAVSRTSSFSSDLRRKERIGSNDDSAYSEVYSTIQELSELPDPFEEEGASTLKSPKHSRTQSNVTAGSQATLSAGAGSKPSSVKSKGSTTTLEFDFPPPLPPKIKNCRAPALPPYPSSIVRAVQEITQPLKF